MEYKYIDIHCHPNLGELKKEQEAVIARMREESVAGIVVGVDLESSREAARLAAEHEHLYATVGLHPNYTQKEQFDRNAFAELLKQPKVVGVGECGLDYFRLSGQTEEVAGGRVKIEDIKEKQWGVFKQQVELAIEHDKPLMVHCRPSKGSMDAYEEVASYLESTVQHLGVAQEGKDSRLRGMPRHQEWLSSDAEYAPASNAPDALLPNKISNQKNHPRQSHSLVRGNMHFFVGNLEMAKRFWALGFTTSFTGVITFTHDYDEVVREAPLNMILTETDAPYAAPVPHRGEVNQPVYVHYVAEAIARIKELSMEEVESAMLENAQRLFDL